MPFDRPRTGTFSIDSPERRPIGHGRDPRSLDHARIAKTGFLAGLGLFAAGVADELAGHSMVSSMPETLASALLTMEVLGVAVAFFVPLIFGAVLPLME